jgi:hypothetical protein
MLYHLRHRWAAKEVVANGDRFGSALRDDRSVRELRWSIFNDGGSIGHAIGSIDSVEEGE